MKKILSITTVLAIAMIMLVSPVGIAATASDFYYTVNPIMIQLGPVGPNTPVPNSIPLCRSSLGTMVCYSPKFIRKAYDVPSSLDGSGQTVVIVDAFGSPTIRDDLAIFDAQFRLPAPSFTIFCGNSPTPFDESTCPTVNYANNNPHGEFGWGFETSLDVEWAHAIAPGANIVLVVASTNSGNAINDAETAAIAAFPGAVFSQSFGIPEIFCKTQANNCQLGQAQTNYANGVAKGDTFFASTGDTGATFGFSTPMGNFPASDIHNTGVSGTEGLPYLAPGTLTPCTTPTPFSCTTGLAAFHGPCPIGRTTTPLCVPDGYGNEQVWNEPIFGAATGGAQSLLIGVPSYQAGLGLSSRGPDVAYNAAVDGGVLTVFSGFGFPALFFTGGTSAGSPQWAGITALANQARASAGKGPIGDLNPVLYSIYHSARYHNDFHDITVGNNQLAGTPVGYAATPGYDLATGLGTPDASQLIVDLVAA